MKVVELFAGVGGFRVGLEAVSEEFYKTVWVNQWEPGSDRKQFAFRCYDLRFPDTNTIKVNKDINEVWETIPPHDLLVGGFPCQDYSVASTGAKGIEGKKGVLWWAINNIISSKNKPRYLLLENVDRMIKSPRNQRGRDFGIILRCFLDNGYYVEWRVINAADYGLPQKRRRIFIFACRQDQLFAKTMSKYVGEEEAILYEKGFFARAFSVKQVGDKKVPIKYDVGESNYPGLIDVSNSFEASFYKAGVMIGNSIYTCDVEPNYDGHCDTLREKLDKGVNSKYFVSDIDIPDWEYQKGKKSLTRIAPDGTTYQYAEGSIPFPDNLDCAGRTMLTSEGTLNRSSHLIKDPETNRYRTLTPNECEKLNGFPEGWTAGFMTERQRYFCMGNSLVVQLVTLMADTLKEIEEGVVDD